jgi:hypothetical protein
MKLTRGWHRCRPAGPADTAFRDGSHPGSFRKIKVFIQNGPA